MFYLGHYLLITYCCTYNLLLQKYFFKYKQRGLNPLQLKFKSKINLENNLHVVKLTTVFNTLIKLARLNVRLQFYSYKPMSYLLIYKALQKPEASVKQ